MVSAVVVGCSPLRGRRVSDINQHGENYRDRIEALEKLFGRPLFICTFSFSIDRASLKCEGLGCRVHVWIDGR